MGIFGRLVGGILGSNKETEIVVKVGNVRISDRGAGLKTAESILAKMRESDVEAVSVSEEVQSANRQGRQEIHDVYYIELVNPSKVRLSYWQGFQTGFVLRLHGVENVDRRVELESDELNLAYENGIGAGVEYCEDTVDLAALRERKERFKSLNVRSGGGQNRRPYVDQKARSGGRDGKDRKSSGSGRNSRWK